MFSPQDLEKLVQKCIDMGAEAGKNIVIALLILVIGRYLIRFLKQLFARTLHQTKVDATVQSFIVSLSNILMLILLGVSVISALGINTTSFAALLASAGVAIGMALSGNLQNFAGGIVILVLRPYKAGDWIEAQNVQGTVQEIQIFHTIITTADNKMVFIPNGTMSSSIITNYTRTGTRRVEWTIGIDYGADPEQARRAIADALKAEPRILATPEPYIAVTALGDSSVDIIVRAWVNASDLLLVKDSVNEAIYHIFNERKINFPFPQQTVHLVRD
ncbi:MAG: mechanosensitive ion channel [Alloprevotella sp.]|nr:mechanosensitive ion channel [Alloprevotella sp.]